MLVIYNFLSFGRTLIITILTSYVMYVWVEISIIVKMNNVSSLIGIYNESWAHGSDYQNLCFISKLNSMYIYLYVYNLYFTIKVNI